MKNDATYRDHCIGEVLPGMEIISQAYLLWCAGIFGDDYRVGPVVGWLREDPGEDDATREDGGWISPELHPVVAWLGGDNGNLMLTSAQYATVCYLGETREEAERGALAHLSDKTDPEL
jgi:hypothetical protein